jgi:signal transduction histidine kinase
VADRGPDPSPDLDPELDRLLVTAGRDEPDEAARGLSFRSRLTLALILSAVLPMTAFGLLVLAIGTTLGGTSIDSSLARLLLFGLAIAALLAIFVSYLLAADLTRPLRAIAAAVDRVSAGDLSTPIRVAGDDELARLADSHNRLAGDLERRNRELDRILAAIEGASPRDGVGFLVGNAVIDAQSAFGMIDANVILGDPATVPTDEVVPGETRPLRALLRVGDETLGVLVGRLPATRAWERADQDLLELFASEVAVSIRNAELFGQVEAKNAQLLELDAAKDDFLRGVSHSLQTPLTSIRAYAEQLELDRPDERLGIIAEQSERLSRMVRQLLTVTRLQSGALHPRSEVVSLATRVRKAWEALGATGVPFSLEDGAAGWLAVADSDQLDQVLWALLDNAVKYGEGTPVTVRIGPDEAASRLRMTVSDEGPGIAEDDRLRLFGRFVRGAERTPDEGSGLGLYVSRELCRAMGGELFLEPRTAGRGAAFSVRLPAEFAEEG